MANSNESKTTTAFAAIEVNVERLVISPKESAGAGGDTWVRWGDRNLYPHFIYDLSAQATTLRACIGALVDYVAGDDVISAATVFGGDPSAPREFVERTAESIARMGGFAWLVTRSRDGQSIARIEVLRLPYLRTDKDAQQFWYNEKWDKGSYAEPTIYPRWIGKPDQTQGVVWVKMQGDNVYPEPRYAAAVKAALTEIGVDDYHLGNIARGFMASAIVNIQGTNPTDDEKAQIEREMSRKLFGSKNAGRVMLSFNIDKDHATTVSKLDTADFSDKYAALAKHSSQQIFTAFRMNPNLAGCASEGASGFNSEEFESAFKLFNRTVVMPIQRKIIDTFAAIGAGDISIKPFTLDGTASANIVE